MRGQPAIPVFFRSGLMATPFLDDKKAGSNAVEIIRGLPRPSQMLPHLPEANRVGTGKEASGGMPPEPPGERPVSFIGKPALARSLNPGSLGGHHFMGLKTE